MNWDALGGAFVTILPAMVIGAALSTSCGRKLHEAKRIEAENAHCARSGGRLVRGQADEFVCIEPREVKWERKP